MSATTFNNASHFAAAAAPLPTIDMDHLMEKQRILETIPYELQHTALAILANHPTSKPMWIPTESGKGLGKILPAASMNDEERARSQRRPIDVSRIQSRKARFDPAGLQERKEKRAADAAYNREEKAQAEALFAWKHGLKKKEGLADVGMSRANAVRKPKPLSKAQKQLRKARGKV